MSSNSARSHAQAVELVLTARYDRESSARFRLCRSLASHHYSGERFLASDWRAARLPYPTDAGCRVP